MTLRQLILSAISDVGEGILESFFPAKYPEARLWRSLLGLDPARPFSRRSFSSILSRLRSEGLVERSGSYKQTLWRLTSRGRKYLEEHREETLPSKDGVTRLVIFDIPESQRSKRAVLRSELMGFKYMQLQKSVWMGESPLPDKFIHLLGILHLRKFVHIFSVKAEGTLRK